MRTKNFVGAITVAVLIALPFIRPTFAHIDTWKIILGIAGVILFLRAGLTP